MQIFKHTIIHFLSFWLIAFSLLSTNHGGIPHYLAGSPEPGFCDPVCQVASHYGATPECVWASARIATTGTLPQWSQDTLYLSFRRILLIFTEARRTVFVNTQSDPRAPPVIL